MAFSLTEYSTIDKSTDVWSRPLCIYTQILSPKKTGFSPIENIFEIVLTFVYFYSMQHFSADPKISSKRF